ncbi:MULTISPECIES: HAMP domain-containing sensor histidine kinase [unclassified Achromobacter]|uniref:sensor histidine kinase n=1 Tax=unclassified Achromobacter TaxID=2626865 RepID=UPI001303D6E6|nr:MULTISPECIES: sensor histidine kinase [unclassified Achromobacter]
MSSISSMKRWRTTPFRLFLVYTAIFIISVGSLLGLDYWRSAAYIAQQARNIIGWEARYLRALRPERLPAEINLLSRDVPQRVNYYGLFAPDGSIIAGTIAAPPPTIPDDHFLHRVEANLLPAYAGDVADALAMAVVLKNGNMLVLVRDVGEITQLRDTLLRSMLWSSLAIALTGMGLGWLYSLRQWRRIRAIQQAAVRIAGGNMSERLPAGGRDELALLANIVNGMLDDIGRLMGEVKSTSDGIAHDLRTPLARLHTLLRHLLQDAAPKDRAMLEQAVGQTDQLLLRFSAILRISEIETMNRRSNFSEVDLDELLHEAAELYEPLAEDKHMTLAIHTEDTGRILGDRALLFEVLCNLVDNAIKFTPVGGKVMLALSMTPHGPCVCVSDSGPGIDETERESVVQRFYRSPGVRDLPGSGLGLSIVSAILHLHDFRLRIASANPGTRMIVQCWPQVSN